MANKAIFFDVDGTLVDSNDQHASSWVDTFARFNQDIAFEDVRQQIGKGGDNLMPALLPADVVKASGEEMAKLRGTIFKGEYREQVVAFPDVCALFRRAAEDGWMIVLASSGEADEVDFNQDLIGCRDLVSAVTTAADAERSKPDPDIFAAALKKTGVEPSNVIVVGDTPYDMEAAGKLGIRAIALHCGGFDEAGLKRSGALALYDDPADLLRNYATSILAGG